MSKIKGPALYSELAANSNQPSTVLEVLKRNLAHFKTQRPCRIPAKQ